MKKNSKTPPFKETAKKSAYVAMIVLVAVPLATAVALIGGLSKAASAFREVLTDYLQEARDYWKEPTL